MSTVHTETMAMLPNDHHPGPRCSCRDCLRIYPEPKTLHTETMAMLPNDHHPGPRCSCRDCLRIYPEQKTLHTVTATEKAALAQAIDDAIGELEDAQRKFLTKTGWVYSSTHPDCMWRWSKSVKGRNYSLGPEEAIRMENGYLEPYTDDIELLSDETNNVLGDFR